MIIIIIIITQSTTFTSTLRLWTCHKDGGPPFPTIAVLERALCAPAGFHKDN